MIGFYLTLFIDLPELQVPKLQAVFFSIVYLPSLQIVEQLPCPETMERSGNPSS